MLLSWCGFIYSLLISPLRTGNPKKGNMSNSEGPECGISSLSALFAITQFIFETKYYLLGIITCDSSKYIMDHPDLTVSNFMAHSIGLK